MLAPSQVDIISQIASKRYFPIYLVVNHHIVRDGSFNVCVDKGNYVVEKRNLGIVDDTISLHGNIIILL